MIFRCPILAWSPPELGLLVCFCFLCWLSDLTCIYSVSVLWFYNYINFMWSFRWLTFGGVTSRTRFICLFLCHLIYDICSLVVELNKTLWRHSLGVCILVFLKDSELCMSLSLWVGYFVTESIQMYGISLVLDEISLKTFGRCSWDVETLVSNNFQISSLKVKYICTSWIKLVIC